MDGKIPYHLKGKEIVSGYSPPPRRRIRAPEIDTLELIEANSLTLLGRLTNPAVQRLWSLFPFLSNRWNLKGKATGADLGRGCFQFSFEYEEDMQKVLDNRPYHYDQWMVVLQKWEPIISDSFPSMIPFWIEIQGLPKHYWQPEMLNTIGEELGEILDMEITNISAKLKILIDGLKPLIFDSMVDFPDGSEALITLEYKNLKNHCSHCKRLTHEKKTCPGLMADKESAPSSNPSPPPASSKGMARNYYSPRDNFQAPSTAGTFSATDASFKETPLSHARHSHGGRHIGVGLSTQKDSYPPRQSGYETRRYQRTYYSSERPAENRSLNHKRYSSRSQEYSREGLARDPSRKSFNYDKPGFLWREKSSSTLSPRHKSSEISRTRRPPLERSASGPEVTPTPPPPHSHK